MEERTPPLTANDDEIAIGLVIRRATDPIDGTITFRDQPPVPFTGWMQLTQLLSRAIDATF